MKAAQVLLILSFSVFKLATCWSCYSCVGTDASELSGCEPFNSSAVDVVNCDLNSAISNVGCISFQLTDGIVTQTTRGCALYNMTSKATCDYVGEYATVLNLTVPSCKICNSDLCNSATIPAGVFSWILVLIFVITSTSLC